VLRDVLAEEGVAATTKCCLYTNDHLAIIATRAAARGEPPFDVTDIIDRVWAPIVYHILFHDRDVTPAHCRSLLASLRLPVGAAT
jgi:hypothetical protein